jgi:hypothetical protein
VELEIPTKLLALSPRNIGIFVEERSHFSVFRTGLAYAKTHSLFPRAKHVVPMEHRISAENEIWLTQPVRATAYLDGEIVAEIIRPARELTDWFALAVANSRNAMREMKTALQERGEELLASTCNPVATATQASRGIKPNRLPPLTQEELAQVEALEKDFEHRREEKRRNNSTTPLNYARERFSLGVWVEFIARLRRAEYEVKDTPGNLVVYMTPPR